jgi:hypothetical protein
MSRIVFAAAIISSVLGLAHHQRVLDRTGLFGSCAVLTATAPEGGQWLECRPGRLTGSPDMSQDACTSGGLRGEARLWICPTTLIAVRSPYGQPTR